MLTFKTRTLNEYIMKCKAEELSFCTDSNFFLNFMNDTYLPLFEDVDVLVTESVISEVRELQKSPQIHIRQKGTHAFTMLDELTVLSTFNLIPSTNSQASLHMYCHQKGLNYKEHTHVQLAYYLKWKEQGTYKPFFVTTDRSTYKTANKIGLNVGFLQ